MNPLSLLTKGRTFRDGKDRSGAYKLPTRNALPILTGAKNYPTFSHTAEPPPDKAASAPTAASQQPDVPAAPAPAVPASEPAPSPTHMSGARSDEKFLDRLTNYGRAFLRTRVLRRKALIPVMPNVQAELKLDNVTVIRNDLNEGDVEVVPAVRLVRVRKDPDAPLPVAALAPTPASARAPKPAPAPVKAKVERENAVTNP